jgi:hypothetical protein
MMGVPIDYYAQIDFSAFMRFIDEIGGVKIMIEKKMKVDTIGGKTKTLRPGMQVLNGELALGYARARNTEGGDFDRAFRQQEVIIAIRERLVSPDALPGLIAKAPTTRISSGSIRLNRTRPSSWPGWLLDFKRISTALSPRQTRCCWWISRWRQGAVPIHDRSACCERVFHNRRTASSINMLPIIR